ncbi:MAG TPA: ankyrin repeat domain-containing protein [Burkholderiaceae bacterium]|nr:ankyrin repeat domain-containing protein [Burkholderiaceae bacterium]
MPASRSDSRTSSASPYAPGKVREHARRMLAAVLACGTLACTAPALSHESEQYTLPAGRDFADLGPYFTRIVYDAVAAAAAETNTELERAVAAGSSPSQLAVLQSADYIAGKVWENIFIAIPTNELLDATLITEPVQSQYPGLVTMYRPTVSIYDDPLLVIDLTKAVRTFFRSGTVSAGGNVFGTDKIIHFINIGRIYHGKYETRIKRGLPENEAIKSAIASTSRNPLTSEDGVLGMLTTGIVSNGDLAADYAGLMFYRNLTETVHIGPRKLPPMLVRDGPYWRVQVEPDSDFFVAFITPHWNEVLNPSKFARYTSGRMRALIRERCEAALDWYRDPRGELRGRAQFEAIERELSTYFGAEYGHESSPSSPVTIAEACFPKTPDAETAKGQAPESAGLPGAIPVRGNAPATFASGQSALGRTPLWWAARAGDTGQVRTLAPTRAEIDVADFDGETPMHAAARAGSAAVASELLSRGADPNRAALYGVTPLMLAIAQGHTEVVTVLLQAGANPNARDLFGKTPLHDAALRGNSRLTDALLERGADPRIADDAGNTALHLAARRGNDQVAAKLLARGADANARNDVGATPRDEARRQGHARTAEQLTSTTHAITPMPQPGQTKAESASLAHGPAASPADGADTSAAASAAGSSR